MFLPVFSEILNVFEPESYPWPARCGRDLILLCLYIHTYIQFNKNDTSEQFFFVIFYYFDHRTG